nr:reverse transcriptase domain-containing protein [Tanacetum cinerariifolium]
MINMNFQEMMKEMQPVKFVDTKCETCGDPHSYTEYPAVGGYTQEAAYATTVTTIREINTMRMEMKNDFETSMEKNQNELKNMMSSFLQMQQPSGSGSLPSNTIANPRGDLKAITTRSGVTYDRPMILPTPSPLPKEVERETEATRTSFANALLHMPKFASTFKCLLNQQDQEKTTFTCPYGTFAYRRMPFGLCNAPGTFQRCMMAIFYNMIDETMEVFMDDFSIFGDSFSSCLSHLDKMIKRCKDTNLVLNWEKCHFMVREGIVLGHKISKSEIKVDRAKVDVIVKLRHPTSVKGV